MAGGRVGFVVVALALCVGSACAVRPGIAGSEYTDTRDRLRRPDRVQRLRRARRRACEAELLDVAEPRRLTARHSHGDVFESDRPRSQQSHAIAPASAQPARDCPCDSDDLTELVE